MKKLQILLLLLTVFLVGKAQVLDTVSLESFKVLRHKQIKAFYSNDEDALEFIENNQIRKIHAYVYFGLAVPLAVTANPAVWMPLTPAIIKLSNNTRKSLYNKLLYYERIKYSKDTIKMKVSIDSNSTNYLYANYKFDITFEEFKALSKKQQFTLFNINDTTDYINDYSNTFKNNTKISYIGSNLLFTLSSYLFFEGAMAYFAKGEMYFIPVTFFVGAGTIFTSLGIYVWPTKAYVKKMNSQRILYNNLQQYYLTHNVYRDVAKYIKKRREYYYQNQY